MPENPSAKSLNEAPGPVTYSVVPSTPSIPRRPATTSGSWSVTSGLNGRIAWTALPSCDGISGVASPTRASPAMVFACARRSPICPSCCWSSFCSPSHRRITGRARVVWNSRCSSVTRVDSALSGRKAAESFSWTELSPPPSDPRGPASPNHRRAMIAGRSQRGTEDRRGMISLDGRLSRSSREYLGADDGGDMDEQRRELALLLRRLTVELDAVGQRFADLHGLNRTDVRALVAIMDAARRGQSLTAGGLGDAVDLRSASTTALVDRLERVGHVRRVRDPEDRRRVALEISDSAMAAGGEFFGGLQRDLVAAMSGFTDDERAVVHRFLTAMTD